MRRILPLIAAMTLHPAAAPAQSPAPAEAPLQALVVVTDDWDATSAMLQRYERESADAPWRPVGTAIAAVVGRTGLAWGRGVHGAPPAPGPVKREGDGKAPAGIFRLGTAFGYAPADEARWIRLPYVQSDAGVECVDDSNSHHYNRLVDRDAIAAPDWTSHEEMRRDDHLYQLGIWVDHNAAPTEPGGGSCIFLHVWRAPGEPTIGCTAMELRDLRALLRWLDPRARPVLVQAPRAEIDRLRGALSIE